MADAIGGPQMRCTFLLQNLEKQDQLSSFVNIQDSIRIERETKILNHISLWLIHE